MGRWVHRKGTKQCSCGSELTPSGYCRAQIRLKDSGRVRAKRGKPYRRQKGEICEDCGFVPVHSCQLDVDHIDGNHNNNRIENLRTLCANCHRLKTYMNRDWESKL